MSQEEEQFQYQEENQEEYEEPSALKMYCYNAGYESGAGDYDPSVGQSITQGIEAGICQKQGFGKDYANGYEDAYNQNNPMAGFFPKKQPQNEKYYQEVEEQNQQGQYNNENNYTGDGDNNNQDEYYDI